MATSRPLPDESVIKNLRGYSIEDVRVFLITRSSLVSEVCEKPELTELAYAIGVLEGADVSGQPKEIVQNIKLLVFGKAPLGPGDFHPIYSCLCWAYTKPSNSLPAVVGRS